MENSNIANKIFEKKKHSVRGWGRVCVRKVEKNVVVCIKLNLKIIK